MHGQTQVTSLLNQLRASHGAADGVQDRLYEAVYPELRRVAAAIMRSEGAGHVLQPTALVHEAYIKLVDGSQMTLQDRTHFIAVATRAMRQVLVDYARRRDAAKRGGQWKQVTLDESIAGRPDRTFGVLELDDALRRLASVNDRIARVVELRVFGGLPHEAIADVLSVSVRTAAGDWAFARRWLAHELKGPPAA